MVHEGWYYLVRSQYITKNRIATSIPTRKLVGCLFSTSTNCMVETEKVLGGSNVGMVLTKSCKSNSSEIEIYSDLANWSIPDEIETKYIRIAQVNNRLFKPVISQFHIFEASNQFVSLLNYYGLRTYVDLPHFEIVNLCGEKICPLYTPLKNVTSQEIIVTKNDYSVLTANNYWIKSRSEGLSYQDLKMSSANHIVDILECQAP